MKKLKKNDFTRKYIFALSLIAIFSLLAYFNLTNLINAQAKDGEVINISGRQRMLSQKIALFAINYKTKSLDKTIKLMESSHKDLLSIPMSDNIKKIYFSKPIMLDKNVKEYIKNAKKVVKIRDGQSLSYVLNNSQNLLEKLDKAVFAYQMENEHKTEVLQRNELFIVFFVLITLIFEAIFIFRPANRSIVSKTEELQLQKFNSEMVIQTSKNAIIAIDDKLDIFTYNKSAVETFGFKSYEMNNLESISKIMHEEDFLKFSKDVNLFMNTSKIQGMLNKTFELSGIRKNGESFPFRITIGANNYKNHKIIVANFRDITLEKEKEDIILRQSKFVAMGEMIGAIAHQWRQPLNALNIHIENLEDDYEDKMVDKKYIDTFITQQTKIIQFMSKTIDNFRNFFRINKDKEIFSIKTAIEDTINIQSAQLIINHICVNVNDKDFKINSYKNEFQQVILNLISNAKDAILSNKIQNPQIDITIDDGIIKITDNASGIPMDIIDRVFEPYFTTKGAKSGMGMGLYMSKMIIEDNMKGSLSVSNVDEGAEFIIKLEKYDD